GEELHASFGCRSPLEGRIGIPHHAVQVREVGCGHGKDLSALVHSPPKNVGLPRGRCDVKPPGIAFAADEQIEYSRLRRHHGERSIRAGLLSLEAGWIDALQSGGVVPDVPERQYVLTLPYELRKLAAFKVEVLSVTSRSMWSLACCPCS